MEKNHDSIHCEEFWLIIMYMYLLHVTLKLVNNLFQNYCQSLNIYKTSLNQTLLRLHLHQFKHILFWILENRTSVLTEPNLKFQKGLDKFHWSKSFRTNLTSLKSRPLYSMRKICINYFVFVYIQCNQYWFYI